MKLSWRDRAMVQSRSRGGGSVFAESTLAMASWQRTRLAAARWGWAGLICGALAGVVALAPASWLANALSSVTGERLLLAEARGTVWSGSAVAVLTGGTDSRSAAALPGRLSWAIGMQTGGVVLRLNQACCMSNPIVLQLRPGLGRLRITLLPGNGSLGEWPAAWLAGLGAPWNTLQLGGSVGLMSQGINLEFSRGAWLVEGQAVLELNNVSSRVSTLERLGSYRLSIQGRGTNGGSVVLRTLDGALLLDGSGTWAENGLRFHGEARAASGAEAPLSNLLNILGRRQGALSVISIGRP